MSRGKPNQQKVVSELRELGYSVKVKHNQIHVLGVEHGMTIKEAKEFIKMSITKVPATLICHHCGWKYGIRQNGDCDIYRPDGTHHSTILSVGTGADEIKVGKCPVGHGECGVIA